MLLATDPLSPVVIAPLCNLEFPLFWFSPKKKTALLVFRKKQNQKDECCILLAIELLYPIVISVKDKIEEVTLQSLDFFSHDCSP